MEGMFWAGLLLSSIPLTLGVMAGVYALRRLREPDAAPEVAEAPRSSTGGPGVAGRSPDGSTPARERT